MSEMGIFRQPTSRNCAQGYNPIAMWLLQRRALLVFALCIPSTLIISPAWAQFEGHDYHGKQIFCYIRGREGSCGIGDGYEAVFVGTVVSVSEIANSEKRLRVMPEEVFAGTVAGSLTVTTDQGGCFGDFHAGDKWLFYLQRNTKTKPLLLKYNSPTRPIADAQAQVEMLRRLAQTNDSGIIMGQLTESIWNDNKWETSIPLTHHRIIAKQQVNSREYAAFTDNHGHYEFEPLPPGKYQVSANTAEGLWTEEGSTTVSPRSCSLMSFGLEPDGSISGRVMAADGEPAKYVQVAIVPVSAGNLQFTSALSDELGRFEVKSLHPGRYFVGVGIQPRVGNMDGRSGIYYPGVRDRNLAVIIDLGRDEKRASLNFQLPRSTER
jgi:hypothetical protein